MKKQSDNLEQILELLEQGKTREDIIAQFGDSQEILDIIDEMARIDAELKPHPAILQKAIDGANLLDTQAKTTGSFFGIKFFAIAGSVALVAVFGIYMSLVGLPNTSLQNSETQFALRDVDNFSQINELDDMNQTLDEEFAQDLESFANSLETSSSEFDPKDDAQSYDQFEDQINSDFKNFEKDFAELAMMYDDMPQEYESEFDELVS